MSKILFSQFANDGRGFKQPPNAVTRQLFLKKNMKPSIPNAGITIIEAYQFNGGGGVDEHGLAYYPDVIEIGKSAFPNNNELKIANFPKATTINNSAFYNVKNVTEINLPSAKTVGDQALSYCPSLEYVTLGADVSLGQSVFAGSRNLKMVTFLGRCTAAHSASFNSFETQFMDFRGDVPSDIVGLNCATKGVIIRSETLQTLPRYGLISTYILNQGNSFYYVPSSLVEAYKSEVIKKTSSLNDEIKITCVRALEDYTVDGTITGDLDMSKI